MDAEKVVARGRKASMLIADPVLQEALEDIKRDVLDNFQATSEADAAKRENLYFMLKAVEKLQIKLESYRSNGIIEERNLDKKRV